MEERCPLPLRFSHAAVALRTVDVHTGMLHTHPLLVGVRRVAHLGMPVLKVPHLAGTRGHLRSHRSGLRPPSFVSWLDVISLRH